MSTALELATEARVRDDIHRAWDWLDRWGHQPTRRPLDTLRLHQLIDIRETAQRRVRALAETWQQWWPTSPGPRPTPARPQRSAA